MKRKLIIVLGLVIILGLAISILPRTIFLPKEQTRTSREGMSYGGQNCIMYNDKLYWEQSLHDGPPPESMKMIGTVTKAVDSLPSNNFEAAVTAEGSEIYYTDNNKGVLIVKEGDLFYTYSLQDNS